MSFKRKDYNMANRYVRLYNGPEQSTIIGFSASAVPDQQANVDGFFEERGYETHHFERYGEEVTEEDKAVLRNLGGVSFMYLGIKPPLADTHIDEFVGWCRQNVDPYHNSGLLIDNRDDPSPISPFSVHNIVAEW